MQSSAALDKTETVAYRMYIAECELHEQAPKEWYELDGDEKFEYIYLAMAAIREMADLSDTLKASVVEAYRGRPLFPVPKDATYESNMGDHFAYGWNEVFMQFIAPDVEPTVGHA